MRGQDPERGSLSVFTVVVAASVMILLGLVVDGGAQLQAIQSAQSTAREAARAGVQAVQPGPAARGVDALPDSGAAIGAAQGYLAAADSPGSVSVTGDTIVVSASQTWSPIFLGAIGIGSQTVSGQAEARLARVVEGVEQ